MAWPALVFDCLAVGVRALISAALVATLISTLDSVLNGAPSLVVNDFIKTRRRQFTGNCSAWAGCSSACS